MVKILVADTVAGSMISGLRQLAGDVIYAPELTAAELHDALTDVEILVVRSTRVSEGTINAARELALIIRAGAGVNTIDVNAATNKGIYVANCPGKNASAVAELVIGLLIAMDRGIVEAATDMRGGVWKKNAYARGMGLAGNCMGILGLGATGKAVATAAHSLGMEVVAWSRSLTPKRAARLGVGFCATPIDVARRADVVSIHLAAAPSSYHLVNRRFLQKMRKGAFLINTARAEIVDMIALKEAIQGKGLRVAMDVFVNEPAADGPHFIDPELMKMVTATPHIAASTREAMDAVAWEVIRIARDFISNIVPPNAVNAPKARTVDGERHRFVRINEGELVQKS